MGNIRIEKAKTMAYQVGLKSDFIMHEKSGKTTEDAVSALGVAADNIIKTLILFASKENKYVGTIILGTDKVDQKKVAKLSKVKKLRFSSPDQIEKLTGFVIGGVPPLAIKFCDECYIDNKVLEKEFVIGAGGDEHCGIKFSPTEFKEKVKIAVSSISL
jgi:Cys-tRNA(Pro) deacylase